MFRRWGLLILGTLAAAAVIGASAGAHTQQVVLPPAHVSTSALVKKILASHGIDPKGVVVQHGVWNYAGPSCPGIGWTCTTAKRVVQFSTMTSSSQFQCTPSTGGSATPPSQCTIVQVSSGGTNNAQCFEQTNVSAAVSQDCEIDQTNTTGNNYASVTQQVSAQSGSSQDATQTVRIDQDNGSGQNSASVLQQITEQTQVAGPGGTQKQDGWQSVGVDQESTTGDNHATVSQSLTLQELINGRNNTVVNQLQNTTDDGPNTNAGIVQYSISGKNDATLNQLHNLNAQAPNGATGTQQQGTLDGGLNGHFDQTSSGLSTNHGYQQETQVLSPNHASAGLSQTQYGPFWAGSPQGSNPNDSYNIQQQSTQQASNSAIQNDQGYGNCDTSGNCHVNQQITQNGNGHTQSCSGMACHIGLIVDSVDGTSTCMGLQGDSEEESGLCPNPPDAPSGEESD